MTALTIRRAGPGITVQDLGRPGHLAFGLSRGGAVDRRALYEGAALLGQPAGLAALEMAGVGGVFEAGTDLRIALTGAPMTAAIEGARVAWNACHALPRGTRLEIGAARLGSYGYLSLGGGIDIAPKLGSRSSHLAAGIGAPLTAGAVLPVGPDPAPGQVNFCLDPEPRFEGGLVRVVPGPQTRFFAPEDRARFAAIAFRRDTRGNRMGVRFLPEGAPFDSTAGLTILSEPVVPGDIQITGDGAPFVLLAECQTTGGYPRIGSVLPADLPRVAQAAAGNELRFSFLSYEEAAEADRADRRQLDGLPRLTRPLVRHPSDIRDLLGYQLISGMTAGDDPDGSEHP